MDLSAFLADADDTSFEEALAFLISDDFDSITAGLATADAVAEAASSSEGAASLLPTGAEIEATPTAFPEEVEGDSVGHQQSKQRGQHGRSEALPVTHKVGPTTTSHTAQLLTTTGSTALEPANTPRRGGGRAREQLIHLRGVAQTLETQLEDLKAWSRSATAPQMGDANHESTALVPADENKSEHSNMVATAPLIADGMVLWREIAVRQYAARCRAENENAQLKQSLEAQIRVARRLENLLKGHHADPVSCVQVRWAVERRGSQVQHATNCAAVHCVIAA
ncbi:hypothetical protein BBJ28_00014982 [Nothophytophthora sp. Chile5]|nr:hypothetical protein BBJ28_00014982 [Nothophytophthora sp. Chile5]